MIVLFVFYVDSISVAATVAEITYIVLVLSREDLGFGPEKIKFFTLETSLEFHGVLLLSVIEHQVL